MRGPTDEQRERYGNRAVEVAYRHVDNDVRYVAGDVEASLQEILDDLLGELAEDVDSDDDWQRLPATDDIAAAEHVLASIEAWSALASYVVASLYAPQSPFPRGFGGWASGVAERLRDVTTRLHGPMTAVARVLRPDSWSIGVGFPWGVSVGLSWNV
jgi:hypothetical protein